MASDQRDEKEELAVEVAKLKVRVAAEKAEPSRLLRQGVRSAPLSTVAGAIGVGALLNDAAAVDEHNRIRVAHGAQAVSHHQIGAFAGAQVSFYFDLHHGIEGAGGLVQDEKTRAAAESSGDAQALQFSTAESAIRAGELFVQAKRPGRDGLLDASVPYGGQEVAGGNAVVEQSDVIPDGAGNQGRHLWYVRDGPGPVLAREVETRNAIQRDAP